MFNVMLLFCMENMIVGMDGMTVKHRIYVNVKVNVLLCLGIVHQT